MILKWVMNLNREDIKYLLKVVIFIALFVLTIRFFIYMLPVIIIALVIMLIYDSYKKNHSSSNKDGKKKNNKIEEATIIKERKND